VFLVLSCHRGPDSGALQAIPEKPDVSIAEAGSRSGAIISYV
jgi:hypothetical protein